MWTADTLVLGAGILTLLFHNNMLLSCCVSLFRCSRMLCQDHHRSSGQNQDSSSSPEPSLQTFRYKIVLKGENKYLFICCLTHLYHRAETCGPSLQECLPLSKLCHRKKASLACTRGMVQWWSGYFLMEPSSSWPLTTINRYIIHLIVPNTELLHGCEQ